MPVDLERLERLDAHATSVPWRCDNPDDSYCMNILCVTGAGAKEPGDEKDLENVVAVTLLQTGAHISTPDEKWEVNAELIVAARNALPELIAEVKRLRIGMKELESLIQDTRRRCGEASRGDWNRLQLDLILAKVVQMRGGPIPTPEERG